GYAGSGLITPRRKPPGRERSAGDKAANRAVNTLRAAVERAIAHLKDWKIFATPLPRALHPLRPRRQGRHRPRHLQEGLVTPVNRPPGAPLEMYALEPERAALDHIEVLNATQVSAAALGEHEQAEKAAREASQLKGDTSPDSRLAPE
ncbi:transposase family protein, partial [Streptomyces sp. NPDC056534]|uniref:transposase family protein n=1 Tax=Streptomyces sp. NPDC056534 TaxID=3345857 RepID=UPI0036C2C0FA